MKSRGMIKRVLSFMLSITLILSVFSGIPTDAFASEVVSKDEFTYEVLNGTYCRVTKYTGEKVEVMVPSEIDGYIVQEISSNAFANNSIVEKVVLPETVERLGTNLFSDCTKLNYVGFGNKITAISYGMFSGCTSLEKIDIPTGISTIGANAFTGCTALTTVNLPETLTTIDYYAFRECTGLKNIKIPDSVTAIAGRAFYDCVNLSDVKLSAGWNTVDVSGFYSESPFQGCSKLTEITLPEGMTAVPVCAFRDCSWLTKVTFPSGMAQIGSNAFSGCSGLTEVTLPEGITELGSGAFDGCSGLTEIRLPESITKLNSNVFANCSGLEKVELPETLTTIDYYAFRECTGLKNIRISDSVTAIAGRAFYDCANLSDVKLSAGWNTVDVSGFYSESPFQGCSKLTEITLPEGMTAIPVCAFRDCSRLKKVTFPSGMVQIGSNAFSGCSGLTEVTLPEGITELGSGAFDGCSGLTEIRLPESITKLNSNVFANCSGLEKVELPETLTTIDYYAFRECTGLKNIRISDSVTAIAGRAFYDCKNLSEVKLPAGWNTVNVSGFYSESPFQGCSKLTEVTLPEGMTAVPAYAFKNCVSLEQVILSDTISEIGYEAFSGCTSLNQIWLPNSVSMIQSGAFSGCAGLTIHGEEGSYAQQYAGDQNIPFSTERMIFERSEVYGKVVDKEGNGVSDVSVSFYDMNRSIPLAATVLSGKDGSWSYPNAIVGDRYTIRFDHPYYAIDEIKNVVISRDGNMVDDVVATKIMDEVETPVSDFSYQMLNGTYCSITGYSGKASEIIIPSEINGYIVQEISSGVFKNNKTVEKIVLPNTVERLGINLFSDCTNLNYIGFGNKITAISYGLFSGCTALKEINVPTGVTSIGANAFAGCTALTTVNLPETLTTIDYYAFRECTGLKNIRIPDSVTAIAGRAFYDCANLSDVKLSAGWNTVDVNGFYSESPFQGCSKLTEITLPEGMTSVPACAFRNCSWVTKVTFPSGMAQIGSNAFSGCSGLAEVTLPEGITELGSGAFDGCSGLTEITLPEGITELGSGAFDGCSGLTEIRLPESITKLNSNIFANCSGLEKVELPETLTTINYYAFRECTGLKNIKIPDSVTAIAGRAFYDCVNLSDVKLSAGWNTVDVSGFYSESPFQGCSKLAEITLPEGMTAVPDYAFKNCSSLKRINFPEGMTQIGYSTFENCTGLNQLDLSDTVTVIKDNAFNGCIGFRMLNFNEKLEFIGQYAFSGCDGLVSLVLNEGLKTLSNYAFANCANLTAARIPKGVISFGRDSFKNCPKLTIYCYSGTEAHKALENTAYKYSLLDEHEHVYETTIETVPTCTRGGSQIKTCTICGYNYIELVDSLGHDYTAVKTEATCTEKGYTTYTCSRCNETYQDSYVDALGHTYGEWQIEKEPTCTEAGSKYRICSVCNEKNIAAIAASGHSYVSEVVEPTCTSQGYTVHTCSVCQNTYRDTYVKEKEHVFGDWVIDVAATVLAEGSQHRICSACGYKEMQSIERVKIDIKNNDSYGLANFTVVNAQTLNPISGAQIFVSTEKDGENTFTTDAEGKVSIVLPVGKQAVSVYASGCLTRNLKVNIASGENEIKPIGLSDMPTYNAEIKSELMTIDEIEAAGIDTNAPGNRHVYKYELRLEFEPEIDAVSIISYFNEYKEFIGGYSPGSPGEAEGGISPGGSGNYLQYRPTVEGGVMTATSGIRIKLKEEIVTVYPVSEYFYIIVRGDVRWLKEMFDVEMLVINNSQTDTLEDLTATLELPEGLSLATMKGEQQTLEKKIDRIDEGKSESIHWYVRGDTAGSYNIQARLQGMVMPFEEEIDDIFVAKNQLQVWAGNALNLHFEFPNAAYYGVDYPITITLTNVSDITLYNISHMVQIEQGMIIYHSDGTKKERIELSDWKTIGVKEFHPGDQIIIQASVNIFFQSERIQMELEKLIGIVDGVEQLMNAYKAIETAVDATGALLNCVNGCSKALENFNFSSGSDMDKLELFKQLSNRINSLVSSYSTSGNRTLDAAVGLANSGLNASLNAITNDPDKWLREHSVSDIKALLSKLSGLENAITSGSGTSNKFDIYDSIRTAISAIPIRFALKNVIMTEDEDNTTSIPWSYTVVDTSEQYFGVSSVSRYLSSLTQAAMGEVYEQSIPWYMQLIPGLDDPLHREEAIKYIQATENEISKVKAKDATGEVRFRAWIERNTVEQYALDSSEQENRTDGDMILSCDNENATCENGVLSFTGDGTISIIPKSQNGGTLHIEDSAGNSYTYVIGVVEEHTCMPGEQEVVIAPTEEYDGFAVKQCKICGDILEIIPLSYEQRCKNHNFSEWETETEATCVEAGVQMRTCSLCGAVEYQFTETGDHSYENWEVIKEATCTEAGEKVRKCSRCDYSESEEIAATGHDYEEVVTEPTCTEGGYTTHTCKVCGDSYVDSQVEALGHDLGAWTISKAATCTEAGEKVRKCSRCDYSESEKIAATGHSYEEVVTAPTCTEEGYTTHRCKACGDSYVDSKVAATGHNYVDGTCTNCGQDDPDKQPESDDHYALRYITVNGRTAWYYANQAGQVDTSYTGVTDNETGWWYVRNGEVDFTYTGLAQNESGWWRIVSGAVDFNCTSVVNSEYGWWYVRNGQVDFAYTGIAPNETGWWRIVNGAVDFNCTSVVNSEYGWWYVRNGQIDFTYTGLASNENGWWRIVNGQVDFNCTSVVNSEYGWWYVRNGQIDFTYTGLASNENGWWRIVNGQVDFGCTSVVNSEYGWWYVINGQIDFTFTGLAANEYGWWYIRNGQLDFSYSGYVNWYGVAYRVQNGQVMF